LQIAAYRVNYLPQSAFLAMKHKAALRYASGAYVYQQMTEI
jgi:hypothetical protein